MVDPVTLSLARAASDRSKFSLHAWPMNSPVSESIPTPPPEYAKLTQPTFYPRSYFEPSFARETQPRIVP